MKYIDSSAFVKYYSDEKAEKGAEKVRKLIDTTKLGKETIISFILLIGEVISAFDKWVRLKIITKREFDEIISVFVTDLKQLTNENSIMLEGITPISMIFSIDYIMKYHLTVNDSLHLYTALMHKRDITEFVCSDNNLINAAKNEGLKVTNPEKE
jgi:predicted nucleic acid-binding protein